jgi:signal transduction histidine kinase
VELLDNAVRHAREEGLVSLRLSRRGDRAAIEVADDGVGIDPAFAPHLFERFRQADGSITRTHGGLGVGLAISRHLVEMHGVRIGAYSDGPGRGSTFTIELPLPSTAADGRAG